MGNVVSYYNRILEEFPASYICMKRPIVRHYSNIAFLMKIIQYLIGLNHKNQFPLGFDLNQRIFTFDSISNLRNSTTNAVLILVA